MKKIKSVAIFILSILLSFCITTSGFSAFAYSEPKTDNCKVHFLSSPINCLSVLIECNGKFGMVDSGEDRDFPNGLNPRYPDRELIEKELGYDDEVISYLKSLGVNRNNFEFYIGTHPHSDHIGSADEIIREFKPKRVYTPEYSDSFISSPDGLWDNLYIYDNMLAAAIEANSSIIMNFKDDAPIYPERVKITGVVTEDVEDLNVSAEITNDKNDNVITVPLTVLDNKYILKYDNLPKYTDEKEIINYTAKIKDDDTNALVYKVENSYKNESLPLADENGGRFENYNKIYFTESTPKFTLGDDLQIEILNGNKTFSKSNPAIDANDLSFGVLLTYNDKTCFIGGDINNHYGDEDILAEKIGKVNLLCLNHHGSVLSNSPNFLHTLNPDILVLPGDFSYVTDTTNKINTTSIYDELMDFSKKGVPLYITGLYHNDFPAVTFDFKDDLKCNIPQDYSVVASSWQIPCALYYQGGFPTNHTGFVKFNNKIFAFNNSPVALSYQWLDFNGNKYFAVATGDLAVGWTWIDDKCYYFDENGKMAKNQIVGTSFVDESGVWAEGWNHTQYGWWYASQDGTYKKDGFHYINGNWYYLDDYGYSVHGWQEVNGSKYYLKDTGIMARDEIIDGCYFNENGKYIKGSWQYNSYGWWYEYGNGTYAKNTFQKIDDKTYYFDENGYMVTGDKFINNDWYYFYDSGEMAKNCFIGNYRYDENGKYTTFGFQRNNTGIYYVYDNNSYAENTFQKYNNKWYYFDENGYMVTGWRFVDNNWYYFGSWGSMVTDWFFINGNWYYFKDSGEMVTSWQKIDKNWYFFDSFGAMQTGWIWNNNNWFYCDSSGIMQTSWQWISNSWYYFDDNGYMAKGWHLIDNEKYFFDNSGVMARGWTWDGNNWYYFDNSGNLLKNAVIDGNYVNENGIWIK